MRDSCFTKTIKNLIEIEKKQKVQQKRRDFKFKMIKMSEHLLYGDNMINMCVILVI